MNPKKPAELKSIARKKEVTIKDRIPKCEPRISADIYIGMSEKSIFKKGIIGNIGTLAKNPKASDQAINNELSIHFLISLFGI